MLHIGKNTRSRIVSKGICAGNSKNIYRGSVSITRKAEGSKNYSQCDSLLIGNSDGFPYLARFHFDDLRSIWKHMKFVTKVSGEVLLKEGEVPQVLIILLDGRCSPKPQNPVLQPKLSCMAKNHLNV